MVYRFFKVAGQTVSVNEDHMLGIPRMKDKRSYYQPWSFMPKCALGEEI